MITPVATSFSGPGRYTQRFSRPRRSRGQMRLCPTTRAWKSSRWQRRRFAALTFSGLGTEATLTAAKRELLVVLAGSSWRAAEEPAALFYDLPFTIPFLRRNEVVVRVAPTAP